MWAICWRYDITHLITLSKALACFTENEENWEEQRVVDTTNFVYPSIIQPDGKWKSDEE